jgi:hypothetical protein
MILPKLDQTLSIGTVLTVLATIAGLLYAWRKDLQLKRKDSADKNRKAAALIAAKLDRWKALSIRFYGPFLRGHPAFPH